MKQFNHIVVAAEGIHARPATELTQFAKTLSSDVKVVYNGKTANAKNVMKLMSLHAYQNAEVTFQVSGPDEEEEVQLLQEYVITNV